MLLSILPNRMFLASYNTVVQLKRLEENTMIVKEKAYHISQRYQPSSSSSSTTIQKIHKHQRQTCLFSPNIYKHSTTTKQLKTVS